MLKHYVELHYADSSTSKIIVKDRNLEQFEVPKGVVKFRFFDTNLLKLDPRSLLGAVKSKPYNYSEYHIVD